MKRGLNNNGYEEINASIVTDHTRLLSNIFPNINSISSNFKDMFAESSYLTEANSKIFLYKNFNNLCKVKTTKNIESKIFTCKLT